MTLVIECRYNLMIALRLNIDSSLKEQITLLHDYKAYGVKYFLIKKFLPHISQQPLKLIQIFEGIICLSTKIFCLSSYFGACCCSVNMKYFQVHFILTFYLINEVQPKIWHIKNSKQQQLKKNSLLQIIQAPAEPASSQSILKFFLKKCSQNYVKRTV